MVARGPMRVHRAGRWQDRGVTTRLLGLLLALVALTGCGVRLDSPDPVPSSPDAAEVVRQREALRARQFAAVEPEGEHADLVAAVATHASAQLDALGGVWVAWPAGDGPTPTADATADVVIGPGAAGLLDSLTATTPDVAAAALAGGDPEIATLYAAIATARTVDADRLAVALGTPGAVTPLPGSLDTPDPAVARALDAAAYRLETLAARERAADAAAEAERFVARAGEFRSLAEGIVAANGWLGTAADPREPYYPVTEDDAATLHRDLAVLLVAAVGDSDDRAGMLDAALSCALEASRRGQELGALPGLAS